MLKKKKIQCVISLMPDTSETHELLWERLGTSYNLRSQKI
jgi:hypothetical protein